MTPTRPLALALCLALPLPALSQEMGTLAELLASTHVHGLAFDPSGSGRLLVATHHGLYGLDPETGAVKPLGDSRQDFMGFSVAAEGRLVASGHPEGGGNAGVLLSTNGGESWTPLADGVGGPVDFHQMTVSAAEPETVYGAYAGGLQRSRDGGESWELIGPAPEGLIDLAASSLDAHRLYAATESGLRVSADGGATWAPAGPWIAPVTFVEAAPEGHLHAFVLGEGLVRAPESEPEDWTTVSGPMGGDILLHFATAGTRAFAVTGSGMLLASDDGGANWAVP